MIEIDTQLPSKERVMKQACSVLLVVSVLLFAGCGGELSRRKAASLLKQSDFFKQRQYLRYQDGMQFSFSNDAEELTKLVEQGVLRKERRPKADGIFRYENVYLTDAGRTASAKWEKEKEESSEKEVLLIPRGEMSVAEVTGVFHRDDVEALADFRWRFEPNTYGLAKRDAGKAVALFRKYDDGWRVVQVEKQ